MTVNLNYGGTATGGGTDYTGVVSVTIAAGATSATFTLPTTNDVINEPDETVVVSLGGISGGGFEAIAANPAANSVTTTIIDNDPTPSLVINDVSGQRSGRHGHLHGHAVGGVGPDRHGQLRHRRRHRHCGQRLHRDLGRADLQRRAW